MVYLTIYYMKIQITIFFNKIWYYLAFNCVNKNKLQIIFIIMGIFYLKVGI